MSDKACYLEATTLKAELFRLPKWENDLARGGFRAISIIGH